VGAKKGLLSNRASAPLVPPAPQFVAAPQALTPPRTQAQAVPLVPAHAAPPPAGGEASGWDSDDDKPAPLKPVHHYATTGLQQGGEASGWDSDEETSASKKANRADRSAIQPRGGNCGAPRQACESFVTAKNKPAAEIAAEGDDDLNDLLGEVMAVDASVRRGGNSHQLVPGFQCMACDFQVLRIDNGIWGGDVEYMFFRNNYPNAQKLRPKLVPRADCVAYCCQCSWKSAESAAPLADVADGLRWRKIG